MFDSVIQFRGTVYENGWGMISNQVMRDKRLPKQSRLIYAYMCSFASADKNGNRTAFPSVSLQCDELGMGEDTYYKWRKYLIELGYLTIEHQKNEKNQFQRNLYIIETVQQKDRQIVEESPSPKKSGTEKPYPNFPSTEKPCKENKGTNSTSSNKTSSNKKDISTSTSEDRKLIDKNLKEKYKYAPFSEIKSQMLLDATSGEIQINSNKQYSALLETRLKRWLEMKSTPKAHSRTKAPIRTEYIPDWFDENYNPTGEPTNSIDNEEKKKAIEEKLKAFRGQ